MGVRTYKKFQSGVTHQMEKAKSTQVQNNAGGYVFSVDDMAFVKRFLVLGTEGGTYYVSEEKLTYQASKELLRIIAEKGKEVVDLIVEVSDKGIAPKNDPALFALALCACSPDKEVRKYALSNLWKVARIPTHLYHFVLFVREHRGMGRLLDKAIEKWFNNKEAKDLAFSLTKYPSRDGYSARDLLRLSKPVPASEGHQIVYNYVTYTDAKKAKGKELLIDRTEIAEEYQKTVEYLRNVELVKSGKLNEKEIVKLIKENRFPMEVIPTDKRSAKVYEAVLESGAGLTWVIRNLGNLSKHGLLVDGSWDVIKLVTDRLSDKKELSKARIHPINILSALKIYSSGQGMRGSGSWSPVSKVVGALDKAFYDSFEFVEPTNKRYYLGLDCSGSMYMNNTVAGMPHLTASEVGACFAMTFMKKEPFSLLRGFNSRMQKINVSDSSSLSEVLDITRRVSWGTTDCSLPMLDALESKVKADVFVVITDNETYAGRMHPFEALKKYRKETGINAKLVVLATSATKFTIADPSDSGMLDIAGFGSDVPSIVAEFAKM